MEMQKFYGTTGLKRIAAIPLVALLLLIIVDAATAASPPNITHTSTGFGNAKQVYTTSGTRTWTVPEGVSQIKITSVGGGGGAYHNSASGILSGGGGGAVIENIVLPVSNGGSLSLVVGARGSSSSSTSTSGGASYVTYNGTRYAYAGGGNPGTASGPGAGGGSGGGRGGYINNKSIINQAASGRYGAAGQTTIFNYDDRTYYSVGGGGSWGDGKSYILQGSAPVALPSNYAYGSGGIVSLGYGGLSTKARSYSGGVGAVAISYVISPVSITLNHSSLSLSPGSSQSLTATVYPSDADDKSYTWSSDKPEIAAVNSSGLVTAKGNGTAIVTATTTDGGKKATCTVTVTTPASGVTVSPTTATIIKGQTQQLTATVAPSSASNKSVSWSSSNHSVAIVSSSGLVTAKAAGTADVTVTTAEGSHKAVCKVTVRVPVTGVSISRTELSLIKGGTEQLSATVSPSDASNKTISWSTTDKSVATVSSSGLVTAVGGGTADIIVTTLDGSYSDRCRVTVNIPVTGIKFNDAAASVGTDSTTQLSYTIVPSDASNKQVTWQSSDTAVAMIDPDTGVITPIAPGGTEITVTTVDGNYSDTMFLIVTSSLDVLRFNIITESGLYPDFGTVFFKTVASMVEYPGILVGSSGEVDALVPLSSQDCFLGMSLLNTLIAGIPVAADTRDIAVPLYMIEGDFNSDNVIDGTDYTILVQRMHFGGGLSEYGLVGDINYDGMVDDLDMLLFGSPVAHTGQSRFMQKGFDIESMEVQAASSEDEDKGFWVPVRSLLETKKVGEGRYEISLQAPSEPVNMLQIALEGMITETSVAAPEGFELIGTFVNDDRTVVAVGSTYRYGAVIPADVPIVTVRASNSPSVVYGPNATIMQRVTETGVETIPLEAPEDTIGTVAPDYGSSGCSTGLGILSLLAAAPLLFRKR